MSILIKDMEMPKCCSECFFAKLSQTGESLICDRILSRVPWDERPFDCPFNEIQEPHGRLIDADTMKTKIKGNDQIIPTLLEWIDCQPTIITASEDGE